MDNIINNIIELDNNEKYLILNQAIYQNKNYFLAAKVTEDEQDVLDEFKLLEEIEVDGERNVTVVTDEKTIDLLAKYLKPQIEE